MPYIAQYLRAEIDGAITQLADEIRCSSSNRTISPAGLLNYAITKLLLEVYCLPREQSYTVYNEIEGVLSCCSKEFYRVFTVPYEEQRRLVNGDV